MPLGLASTEGLGSACLDALRDALEGSDLDDYWLPADEAAFSVACMA